MMRWIAIAGLLCLAAGCAGRIALYSPRLPPTDEHRAATANTDCLECHDLSSRTSHKPTDDCRRCHTLCEEC